MNGTGRLWSHYRKPRYEIVSSRIESVDSETRLCLDLNPGCVMLGKFLNLSVLLSTLL